MNREHRLNQLEGCHDWQGLADGIREAIEAASARDERARLHLRLGRLLVERLSRSKEALPHFQSAFRLDERLTSALEEARAVCWELGNLPMVRKLLELQVGLASSESERARLLVQLGDVALDEGDVETAGQVYEQALAAAGADDVQASERLRDLRVEESGWSSHLSELQAAVDLQPATERADPLVRAARVLRRIAPEHHELEGLLREAYLADPLRSDTAVLYESLLADRHGDGAVAELQFELLSSMDDAERGAELALRFGSRWEGRHGNLARAGEFARETLRRAPSHEAAFLLFRRAQGNGLGDWSGVLGLAAQLGERVDGPEAAFFWANAASVAREELGDAELARVYYERLARVAPQHTALARSGERPGAEPGDQNGVAMTAQRPEVSESEPNEGLSGAPGQELSGEDHNGHSSVHSEASMADAAVSPSGEISVASEPPSRIESAPPGGSVPPSAGLSSFPPASRAPSSAPVPTRASEAPVADESRVAELRAKLEKQEAQKRTHEVVKTLVALGDALAEPTERVEHYVRAADLYANKFMNQAEAVRVNEKILVLQPDNDAARQYLGQMYEKRRNWEKLVELRKSELDRLESEEERARLRKEIALLASERIKKPPICIALWEEVLGVDGDDPDALAELSKLYERSRDYEKLSLVLQRVADGADGTERVQLLTKLGQIVGDRLKDDARAIEVYRALIALEPDNRRAQEQLKKRYVALGRWDDLDDFYAASGRWDEFIRVLETNEARAESDEQRIRMLRKIAELWCEKRERPERAARAYEKILTLDPSNVEAANQLIPIYTSANNAKGLAGVLEVRLSDTGDVQERLAMLRQLIELYEGRLKQPQSAYAHSRAAVELAPADVEARGDAERLAAVAGDFQSLVQTYRSAIEQCEVQADFETVSALRLALGRVYDEHLSCPEDALAEYRAVCDAEPDNVDALRALESSYSRAERFEDLLDVYRRRADLADAAEDSRQITLQIARLQEERLGDRDAAIESYRSALALDPLDAAALEALDRLYQATRDWSRHADILERRLEIDGDESSLIDLKYRLAETQRLNLGEAESSLATYREVLALDPNHAGARGALEGLLDDPTLRGASASVLEGIYEVLGDWAHLIQTLEILAQCAEDDPRRVELYGKIAEIAEHQLHDVTRAFDARAKALATDPAQEGTLAELERLAGQSDAWRRVGELYHQIADRLDTGELARDYRIRAAKNEERLGNVSAAASNYARLLEMDPGDTEALAAIDALYRSAERWDDLISIYRRRIDLSATQDETIELLSQLAELYEGELERPEEAVACYREVLGLDPTSQRALGALDRLYTRAEQWQELAGNLDTRLKLSDGEEEQQELMLRLGGVFEHKLGELNRAIDTYRELLDRNPTEPSALAALEGLSQGEHELAIAEILEPLYQQSGEYDKLVRVHEVQARCADDAGRKVELLHRIATLHEDLEGNAEAAFDAYARALAVEPTDSTTLEGLERLAQAGGRFVQLAATFEELAEAQTEPELKSQLFMAAARTVERDVRDSERAVVLYGKVLDVDSRDRGAIESLQRLFEASERHVDLSEVLQRKARVLDSVDDQKSALYESAALEESVIRRPEAAIRVYEAVLELDPDDVRSMDALIKLYLDLSRWEQLLAVQQRKADLVQSRDEKKALYYQMGAIYERELQDVSRAIDTYQRVLELDPDDLSALGRLDMLYQTSGDWVELLTVLGHEAELTAEPVQAVSYHFRIAELYEKHLSDVERAIELYRDVLNVQADHQPTLAALEGLKEGEGQHALSAAQVLEPVYDAMAEWPKLIGALSVQARLSEDPFSQVDLMHRIASLYEERIQDAAGAFDWYARAVGVDSANEQSLASFERLAGVTDRWAAVARVYDRQLEALEGEPERLVALGLRAAQVNETQLDDVAAAVARYRGVLEVEPENQTAVSALGRLFEAAERWEDLIEVLEREAAIGHTPDEILDCRYRVGQVYQKHLGDYGKAVAAYDEVLSSAPEHEACRAALEELFGAGHERREVARILEPLYEATGDWGRLVQVHEAQLSDLEEPSERLEMYQRIAEDYEGRLGSVEQAFAVFARALHEQPLNDGLREELERLAVAFDGGWEETANKYADVMSEEGVSVDVQAVMGRHLARVFEEELADVEKAEEAYRYVLTVCPDEPEALENLDRIYLALEQWPELAGILEQRAAASEDREHKVELYARLGRVYEDRLGDPDNALRAYRLIFDDLAPTDPEVTAALVRIYEAGQRWSELEEVYKRQLDSGLGDVEQADVRAKLARLASEHLGRDDEAIDGWKRVLDLRGEDGEALDALCSLYEKLEQWAELGDVLERLYDVAMEDDERIHALTRRARLFTDALRRHDEALDAWERVLDVDFSNVEALRSIARLRRDAGEHAELVAALHQLVDRSAEGVPAEELREVHRELARLYSKTLDQPDDAADSWRHLLEVDATDMEAMAELETMYRGSESWGDVVGIKLQRAQALEEGDTKLEELLGAAAIWRDEVGEYDRAVEIFDRVLEIDARHEFAFQELQKLHTAGERWEPLVEVYLARLDATEEIPERSELLRRIARVFERHLDDPNQAFDALVTALSEDYSDDETALYLERVAQETQRWGELITTANEWLKEASGDRGKTIQLCLRLGKWYGENLGRPEYAQPYYAQITQLDPQNAQVLRQMAQIYRQGAQWQKMSETLNQALSVASANDDRKMILVDLGQLMEKHMGDRDQGVSCFQRALDIDPLHVPALDALSEIYSETARHKELASVLERKAEACRDPEEVLAVRQRLGELYENELGSWDQAGAVYQRVIEQDDANLAALSGLARVYDATQKWGELVSVLQRQLDVVATERARVDLLIKLARIQEEQFLKSEVAAERLEQVLEIDPGALEAYEGLERCYRRLKRWGELVATCERHIAEVEDVAKKIDLHEQIARVYAEETLELDRAIDAYQNIVDLDDRRLPALEALARLYEKQGDAAQSIEVMGRVADLTVDGGQRVEMYHRIGRALEEQLGDRQQARQRLEMALDLDPKHLPSIALLRAILTDEADWDGVARCLEQEQKHTESPRARARLLVELGKVQDQMLSEPEAAIASYELAIQQDPECEEAAVPLVEEYLASEQWQRAAPLAETLVRRTRGRSKDEQHRTSRQLGHILHRQGNLQEARDAYQNAHQLDVTDAETVRGLAAVFFELKDWPGALTNYQKVLTSLNEDEVEERTDVYYRLGRIKQEQEQHKQAINNFEKALGLQPDHRPTLEAMATAHQAEGEWAGVAQLKRRLLEQSLEDEERLVLLSDIADIWTNKESDPAKAIEALEEAREIRPQDHVLLHKLLQLYQGTGDWVTMVNTLAAIAEIEKEPAKKARYSYTMAQLYRDKIQDLDRAVELFNEALDLAPDFLEAFERINKILTRERNWKQLERQYRKMIHRVSGKGKTELEFNLWHQLGLVYRDRLSSVQHALEAFKMASNLRPDQSQERVILSELHEVAEQYDEAIAEQRTILEHKALSVAPYRALYRLYQKRGRLDEAWCVASALNFMQQADAGEQQFFRQHRQSGMPQVRGRLTNDLWTTSVFHESQNVYVSKMFEMITPAALQAKIAMLKQTKQLPELDKRLLQDPKTSTVTFAKTFFWAANILGVHPPELYVRSDVPGSVVAVPMIPPASLAGQTVLTGFQPQELTFICGKHLAAYRGEHYIRTLFPTQAELTIMLFAGVTLAAPNTPMPPDMAQQIRVTAQELGRYIQPVQLEGLRAVVKRFIGEGAKAHMKRWNQAVEFTAVRAGFALCGDLEICKKVLGAEQTRPGEPTAAEKMQSLLAYSVSEEYTRLRKALGVAIGS